MSPNTYVLRSSLFSGNWIRVESHQKNVYRLPYALYINIFAHISLALTLCIHTPNAREAEYALRDICCATMNSTNARRYFKMDRPLPPCPRIIYTHFLAMLIVLYKKNYGTQIFVRSSYCVFLQFDRGIIIHKQ